MHKKSDLLSGFVNFQTKMSNNACYAYELKTIKLLDKVPLNIQGCQKFLK